MRIDREVFFGDRRRRLIRKLRPFGRLFGIILLLSALVGVWPCLVYYNRHHQCVQLRNGMALGYNAVFDLGWPFLKPYGALKFSDGTPLVDQPLWSVFVTDTSIYGRTFGETKDEAFDFAWRADTGVVRRDRDAAAYGRLVAEAGEANAGLPAGDLGPLIVMRKLAGRPDYTSRWCPTNLLVW